METEDNFSNMESENDDPWMLSLQMLVMYKMDTMVTGLHGVVIEISTLYNSDTSTIKGVYLFNSCSLWSLYYTQTMLMKRVKRPCIEHNLCTTDYAFDW